MTERFRKELQSWTKTKEGQDARSRMLQTFKTPVKPTELALVLFGFKAMWHVLGEKDPDLVIGLLPTVEIDNFLKRSAPDKEDGKLLQVMIETFLYELHFSKSEASKPSQDILRTSFDAVSICGLAGIRAYFRARVRGSDHAQASLEQFIE